MRQATGLVAGASLDEIERVYRERAIELERVAAAIVGEREVARDVVQDAFAAIVRKRLGFGRRASVDAWIWRAVVNTALNHRKAAGRQRADRVADLASVDGHESERLLDARVVAELAALPERQRLVAFLRYYADLDYATIGVALGIRAGTVASTLSSAHEALHRQLVEERINA